MKGIDDYLSGCLTAKIALEGLIRGASTVIHVMKEDAALVRKELAHIEWPEPVLRKKLLWALSDDGIDVPEPEDELQQQQRLRRAEAFNSSITKGNALKEIELPPKEIIIDDWLKEGDLGFIFAYRGAGKTWLTLSLCLALAEGEPFGPWQIKKKWTVLYIDGEMSFSEDKARILGLQASVPENLHVLNHEVLFHNAELVMNLGDPDDQEIVTQICLSHLIKVLVLDNLGCLVSGVGEDKADEWEKILPWLLHLRRNGIAVIIIHHSGHDRTRMRGTVKREDSAAWVIRLDDQREDHSSEAGAHFISRFQKIRGQKPAPDLDWKFEPSKNGNVNATYAEANRADVVLKWIADGLDRCGAIAKEMNISEGQVSKLVTKLIKAGKVKKRGRDYVICADQSEET